MKNYETVFDKSVLCLTLCLEKLKKSCSTLLSDLPDEAICKLVVHGVGWDSIEVKEALSQRLGPNMNLYLRAMRSLKKKIEQIRHKLKLEEDFTAPFLVNGNIDEQRRSKFLRKSWKHIRGGFNAEKYDNLIYALRDNIDQLYNFAEVRIEPEQTHQVLPTVNVSAYWLSLQSHTCNFYSALHRVWTQSCAGHVHSARLRLNAPKEKTDDDERPEFDCSFLMTKDVRHSSGNLLKWRGVTIISEFAEEPSVVSQQLGTKSVKFNFEHVGTSRVCASQIQFDSICARLKHHCRQGHCLGFISGDRSEHHIHDGEVRHGSMRPLKELLRSYRSTKSKRKAQLILATCVVQLYDTPWLNRKWTIDDIYVDEDNLDRLYVLKAFDPHDIILQNTSSIPSPEPELAAKNSTIFALTIALLEIHFGCRLHEFRTSHDGDDHATEYKIAERLTQEVKEEEPPRFAGVVNHCMYPKPEGSDYGLANKKFRKRFMENVVIPLKEDINDIERKPNSDG